MKYGLKVNPEKPNLWKRMRKHKSVKAYKFEKGTHFKYLGLTTND